jgi:hypothetical protein
MPEGIDLTRGFGGLPHGGLGVSPMGGLGIPQRSCALLKSLTFHICIVTAKRFSINSKVF